MSTPQKAQQKQNSNIVQVIQSFDGSALIRRGTDYRVIGEKDHFSYATTPKDPLPRSFEIPSGAFEKLLKPHDWSKNLSLPNSVSVAINVEFWRRGCIDSESKPTSEIIGYATRHLANFISKNLK